MIISTIVTIDIQPDGLFLKTSQRLQHARKETASIWTNCTVVQGNKLWTIDTNCILHIWELDVRWKMNENFTTGPDGEYTMYI